MKFDVKQIDSIQKEFNKFVRENVIREKDESGRLAISMPAFLEITGDDGEAGFVPTHEAFKALSANIRIMPKSICHQLRLPPGSIYFAGIKKISGK